MLKKLLTVCVSLILIASVYFANKTPVFGDYSNTFELYLRDGSSLSEIVYADKNSYPFIENIKGEGIKLQLDGFSLSEFLSDFDAKIVFSESIAEGISYYAYSPEIKREKTVCGKRVNLQIFIGNSVTVGSPLIYGSF